MAASASVVYPTSTVVEGPLEFAGRVVPLCCRFPLFPNENVRTRTAGTSQRGFGLLIMAPLVVRRLIYLSMNRAPTETRQGTQGLDS